MKIDLNSMLPCELEEICEKYAQPKYRAKQIFSWIHKGARSFSEMSDIPKQFCEALSKDYCLTEINVAKKMISKIDATVKYLFTLYDNSFVETVVMKYNHGYTVCLSCQVGCRMGCTFCQSTKGGLVRSLTAGEILSQLLFAQRDLEITISNIVLMGIGEPLDNYDQVLKFLQLVNHKDGVNIGYRHISLSTCGITPMIEKLALLKLPITLSVSLHSADDKTRSAIMPINRAYNLKSLIPAIKKYQKATNRRISFEYALINGINDSEQDALRLKSLVCGIMCHINLIPINKIDTNKYKAPELSGVEAFRRKLELCGLNATVRRTLGSDIAASCGQLRSHHSVEEVII